MLTFVGRRCAFPTYELYRYQGNVKASGPQTSTGEGTVEVIGGTGKFKNAKGSGTYKARSTADESVSEITLDIEY